MKFGPHFYVILGQFNAKLYFFREIWGRGSMTLMHTVMVWVDATVVFFEVGWACMFDEEDLIMRF